MVTATALGLLGPIALLAAIGLNTGLLWRSAPGLVRALAGPQLQRIPARVLPDGECNVVPLRPHFSPAAGSPRLHRLAA
jgi:hypothetical protein